MSTNRIRMEVNALKKGMFVSDLDRPWHQTPFPLQGFYIRDDSDLKALAEYCQFVYVDERNVRKAWDYSFHKPVPRKPIKANLQQNENNAPEELTLPPLVVKSPKSYSVTSSIKKEVKRVSKVHRKVYEAINDVFLAVQNNDEILIYAIKSVATSMVYSVCLLYTSQSPRD